MSEYSNDGIKLIDKDFGSLRESFQGHTDICRQGYDTDTLSNKTDASSSKTCEISGFSLTSKSTSSKGSSVEQCPLLDLSRLSNSTSQVSWLDACYFLYKMLYFWAIYYHNLALKVLFMDKVRYIIW